MHVHEGIGIITFSQENYYNTSNTIEGSSGSLKDPERHYRITYTYTIPDNEILKIIDNG